ncbi:hypothetical protein CC85DRAFT_144129 [Cutaneotrichosporon oleaginosum]|uniref:GATA-type domain-containing protein n=1 Tax=Cutaneotrichosporon oleaginosum TaxID=879819 RepID=A0A0J0XI72_9TREE|nr:uncharacterized protein CC85DRAFT_144129 [Cutaneotrichosporon oleaginosum]KLT40712.1 hypothetical protein CC85DRAFT_144129 [Cutaneotrichosporon oleaginosum]TXT14238.1 hypothetical protein COLE_00431 [Cutaneotrichosporon oleaginosum]
MVAQLETGRIHSLPVQVTYHLSSSSQSFSTLFSEPQDVYLHPTAGKSKDGDDEVWGAIYLKAVVQGIVMASPELHPAHPGTPDLSLYLLDPRESFLKRSRAAPRTRSISSAGYEVWSGKGLVRQALAEADKGKSLITGRLVRRSQFLNVTAPRAEGMSALDALVAANAMSNEVEAWGIEIFVGLKTGLSSSTTFPGPLHHTVENGSVAGIAVLEEEEEGKEDEHDSPAVTPVRPSSVARIPSFPAPRTVSTSSSKLPPRAIPRHPSSSSPAGPSRARLPVPRKHAVDERTKLSPMDLNMESSSPVQAAQIATRLNRLTDEQKNVLTPDVLSFLEKLAGTRGAQVVASEKRMREEAVTQSSKPEAKRPRTGASSSSGYKAPISECSNCKTTRSSVWRQQSMPNGKTTRVCNACGLYFQKKAEPRPASMWNKEEDGVPRGRGRLKASERRAQGERELKRTMTQAVERDAARIATSRRRSAPRDQTPSFVKDAPQTSPSRGSAPLPRAVRVAAATSVSGSSPAGSSVWHGEDTPRSASNGFQTMQSLAMPLSDDGLGNSDSKSLSWAGEMSAFFDVEGFSAPPESDADPSSPSQSRHQGMSSMDPRNVSSALRHQLILPTSDAVEPSDDDAWSNLFNRTSSFGHASSVGDHSSSLGRSSSFGPYDSSPHEKFDFSQLPPSSPPALPSNLPHSALLFSSPGPSSVSPIDPSPRDHKASPGALSGLRNEVTPDDKPSGDHIQDILAKLNNADIMALFDSLPAAPVA